MNLVDFIQLGVAGIAIVVIWFIVKEFLKFTKHQEDNFSDLIKNDMAHSREVMEGLKDLLKEMYVWMKKNSH